MESYILVTARKTIVPCWSTRRTKGHLPITLTSPSRLRKSWGTARATSAAFSSTASSEGECFAEPLSSFSTCSLDDFVSLMPRGGLRSSHHQIALNMNEELHRLLEASLRDSYLITWRTGMKSRMRMDVRGDSLKRPVRPAYESAPNRPAAPVPLDQALTVYLG